MAETKVVEGARLTGTGLVDGGVLVKFEQDIFPHVKGDIKRVEKEELTRVDGVIKARDMKGSVYSKYDLTSEDKKAVAADQASATPIV